MEELDAETTRSLLLADPRDYVRSTGREFFDPIEIREDFVIFAGLAWYVSKTNDAFTSADVQRYVQSKTYRRVKSKVPRDPEGIEDLTEEALDGVCKFRSNEKEAFQHVKEEAGGVFIHRVVKIELQRPGDNAETVQFSEQEVAAAVATFEPARSEVDSTATELQVVEQILASTSDNRIRPSDLKAILCKQLRISYANADRIVAGAHSAGALQTMRSGSTAYVAWEPQTKRSSTAQVERPTKERQKDQGLTDAEVVIAISVMDHLVELSGHFQKGVLVSGLRLNLADHLTSRKFNRILRYMKSVGLVGIRTQADTRKSRGPRVHLLTGNTKDDWLLSREEVIKKIRNATL